MTNREIRLELEKWGDSPSIINFEDDIIPPTTVWYSEEKNAMVAECGDCFVEIPFIYDVHTDMYQCFEDMEEAIKVFYEFKKIEEEDNSND